MDNWRAGTDSPTVIDLTDEATIGVVPLVDVTTIFDRQVTRYERWVKPAIDFVGALLLLVLTAPVMMAAAIAIRATMGGPALLRQERVGLYGRVFTLYKFRSMEPDRRRQTVTFLGEDRRRTHKSASDPRITSVGGFIRRWSIDELPQFLNVLRADMSLVGPRPEMVQIVAGYQPWQHRRHAVKPGITGLWQVSERGDVPLHEATELDIDYIQGLSLASDLKILALTPLAAGGDRQGF